MSAVSQCARAGDAPVRRVALFGTGSVARALAEAFGQDAASRWRLAQLSNARVTLASDAWDWRSAVRALATDSGGSRRGDPPPNLLTDVDVVIDATASDAVAAAHADWLGRGIAVVTANKRGLGETQRRAQAILDEVATGACYGDSATVGAGLGAIGRLRTMQARGEPVDSIAGVLSGTLSWLFERHDGSQPFSALVAQAQALGLTEPDPRQDVCGADVARKLRILARAAGWQFDDDALEIDPRLACGGSADGLGDLRRLDPGLAALLHEAPAAGAKLAVVARAVPDRLRVGLEWLHPADPLAQRIGCDNVIEIRSRRYRERPLILRGPGAGPALTAEALLDDLQQVAAALPAAAARTRPRLQTLRE